MLGIATFGSRVERNIILVVLILGLLPLAAFALLAMSQIEKQTLRLAEKQLRESTKTYALDLLSQFERAESDIRLLYFSGSASAETETVGGFAIVESPVQLEKTVLALGEDSLLIQIPQDDVVLIGTIPFEILFAELGHVPFGVERCVTLDDRLIDCHGTAYADAAEQIQAIWHLPLASVYDTDIQLSVSSSQLVSVALQHVSLFAKLLPLAILLVALAIGWLLLRQIRRMVAPVAELQAATRKISEGDYDLSLNLDTGDEFETLGKDFNRMTGRLGSSFRKLQALAAIDRLILSGSELDEVVEHGLLLAQQNCQAGCSVFLMGSAGGGSLLKLRDNQLIKQSLGLDLRESTLDQARVMLNDYLDHPCSACFPIRRDGSLTGYLVAEGEMDASAEDVATMSELADRLSVAETNADQASELYRQANYDGLTGLINRQAFNDRLNEQIQVAQRRGTKVALLFLDLDRFKQINDTEGHLTGDELLREVAQRLKVGLRTTDVVARLGGDEFAIVFPDFVDQAELTLLCERLIDTVCHPFSVDAFKHPVDVSVGVSVFPDDGTEPGVLLMKADVAMYKAKEHKGSAFAFFDESLNQATEKRVRIEARLRAALEDRRLELHFQPKISLRNQRIEQVEGLIRWPADDDEPLPPDQFIPVAEDTGLIQEFTRLLIEQSAACLCASDDQRLGLQRVAINISSQQLVRPGFADSFLEELVRADLMAQRMELELTESVFVADADQIVGELNKLRAAGVHVALDDFGTGYSSLNMLRTLPLDAIKIDRSFITPLATSHSARDMARKIVEIARLLDLEVVAEGVESDAELEVLRDIQCDLVQGFLFSQALPLDALIAFLRDFQHGAAPSVVELLARR